MTFYFMIDFVLIVLLLLSPLLCELFSCYCCCYCHRYCCVSCFAVDGVVFVAVVAVWVALLLLCLRPLLSLSCFLWLCPLSAVIINFIVVSVVFVVFLILVSLFFIIIWFSIEERKYWFCEKNCMCIEYGRTPIDTNHPYCCVSVRWMPSLFVCRVGVGVGVGVGVVSTVE